MIKERISECIVTFDPGYISKSGKKTYGLKMYWFQVSLALQNGAWTSAVLRLWAQSSIDLFRETYRFAIQSLHMSSEV